jgi:chitin disaccharide deacetylase
MPFIHVNADDFCLHPDIDHGIWQCVDAHRLSGVSVCATVPAMDWAAVRDLKERGLAIGVHLTLVGEPWLTQPRLFGSWATLVPWLLLPGRSRVLEREMRGQITLMIQNGVMPSHLDSHQHVHVMPTVWPIVKRLAGEFNIPHVRVPATPDAKLAKSSPAGRVLQAMASKRRGANDLPCIGIAHAGHNTVERLIEELDGCKGADVELVAHPGRDTPELQSKYAAWKFDWKTEQAALLSDAWGEALDRRGYTIGRRG